ncbi:MAG: hypothetical protein LN412_04060 [Candidatus Thermoplasmatota archaeon]|nr:hypothetical protein [Candidatus Thermoplasmatota archaeon]
MALAGEARAKLEMVAGISRDVMVALFYLSAWPPAHNRFMDDHIVYALLLVFLGVIGAGRFLGVDGIIEKIGLVRRRPRLAALLG